jgi:hypothetical protein
MLYEMPVHHVNIKSMKSIKKTGRPPTGRKGRPLQLYATDEFVEAIDAWRAIQRPIPNRSDAIRRLVEQALAAEPAAAKPRRPGKRKDEP